MPLLELEPEELMLFLGPDREQRKLISISQVPRHVTHAVLAAEDAHFYEHHGVDPWGILRALLPESPAWRHKAGGIDHHTATGEELLPDAGEEYQPQIQRSSHGSHHGVDIRKRRDPRDLSQRNLSRSERVCLSQRHRRSLFVLFQQTGERAVSDRGGHDCRHYQGSRSSIPPTWTKNAAGIVGTGSWDAC